MYSKFVKHDFWTIYVKCSKDIMGKFSLKILRKYPSKEKQLFAFNCYEQDIIGLAT